MEEFVKNDGKTYIAKTNSLEDSSSTFELVIEDENENKAPKKEIDVIKGDGKDLNISDVNDYIEIEVPKEKKENIIIPEVKK